MQLLPRRLPFKRARSTRLASPRPAQHQRCPLRRWQHRPTPLLPTPRSRFTSTTLGIPSTTRAETRSIRSPQRNMSTVLRFSRPIKSIRTPAPSSNTRLFTLSTSAVIASRPRSRQVGPLVAQATIAPPATSDPSSAQRRWKMSKSTSLSSQRRSRRKSKSTSPPTKITFAITSPVVTSGKMLPLVLSTPPKCRRPSSLSRSREGPRHTTKIDQSLLRRLLPSIKSNWPRRSPPAARIRCTPKRNLPGSATSRICRLRRSASHHHHHTGSPAGMFGRRLPRASCKRLLCPLRPRMEIARIRPPAWPRKFRTRLNRRPYQAVPSRGKAVATAPPSQGPPYLTSRNPTSLPGRPRPHQENPGMLRFPSRSLRYQIDLPAVRLPRFRLVS